jgi:hypothetical protein
MSILDAPLVFETRRNHALEHATIHILSGRFPGLAMVGHSNPTGFFLIGNVSTADVRTAATEALTRLQNGESRLAIHEGCGTNYAVTGALAGVFAFLGLSGTRNSRERLERFPLLILLSTLALIIGQPLGLIVQKRVTTQPEPGSLAIAQIYLVGKNIHRVVTRG